MFRMQFANEVCSMCAVQNIFCGVQYIYISKEEMEAVAEYIKKRGRIAIGELAAKSNMFIDLEAKATTVSSASLTCGYQWFEYSTEPASSHMHVVLSGVLLACYNAGTTAETC